MKNMQIGFQLFHLYEGVLNRLDSPNTLEKILRLLVEKIMQLGVIFVSSRKKLKFPERTLGSSWWVWRWRFEFISGLLEYPSTVWCKQIVKPGMVAIDVGAHIGYYTRILSKLVGVQGRVIAFEPSPENFPVLSQNITSLSYKNIELYDYAVDDKNAIGQLHISPGHSNHSLIAGYTEEQGIVNVKTVTLDAFLADRNIREVDFIKIDVEGNEPHVLAGMKNTLKSSGNVVVLIEYNPTALRCGGWEPEKLILKLKETGLIVSLILPDGSLTEDVFQSGENTVNLLCRMPTRKRNL